MMGTKCSQMKIIGSGIPQNTKVNYIICNKGNGSSNYLVYGVSICLMPYNPRKYTDISS